MYKKCKKEEIRSSKSLLVSAKYKKPNVSSCLESDVHVNLWKESNKSYSLDLGVMFYDIDCANNRELDSICIFLPFNCEKSQIEDLGKILNSSEVVSTIFNDSYKMESGPDKSSMTKFYNNDLIFFLFELGETNYEPKFEESLNGTFLTINVPIPDELRKVLFNLYIRLRITINRPDSIKFLKHDEHIANNILQAAFARMELYDFRLNDIRDTDDKVYQELISNKQFKLVKMRKVHFFFMTDAKDHIANGNTDRMDTRMLEVDKWEKYKTVDSSHALVAYHWKKRREIVKEGEFKNITSFEAFFRNTCNNISWWLVSSYLCFLVAIGTTSSLLSTINPSLETNWWAISVNVAMYIVFLFLYRKGK